MAFYFSIHSSSPKKFGIKNYDEISDGAHVISEHRVIKPMMYAGYNFTLSLMFKIQFILGDMQLRYLELPVLYELKRTFEM